MKKLIIGLVLILSLTAQAEQFRWGVKDTVVLLEVDSSLNYHPYTATVDTPISVRIFKDGSNAVVGAQRCFPMFDTGTAKTGLYKYPISATEMQGDNITILARTQTANTYFLPVFIKPTRMVDSINPLNTNILANARAASVTADSAILATLLSRITAAVYTAASGTADSAVDAKNLAASVQCSTDVKTILGRVPASVALAYNLQQDSILLTKIPDTSTGMFPRSRIHLIDTIPALSHPAVAQTITAPGNMSTFNASTDTVKIKKDSHISIADSAGHLGQTITVSLVDSVRAVYKVTLTDSSRAVKKTWLCDSARVVYLADSLKKLKVTYIDVPTSTRQPKAVH